MIIVRYTPGDPNFQRIENFFNETSRRRYVSELSVVELYSVFSRLVRADALGVLGGKEYFDRLSTEEKVRVAVEHALRTWNVKVVTAERTFVHMPVSRQIIEIPHEFFEAVRCSPEFGLKTLDALHLAYALTIKELIPDLNTFTTLDKDISSRKDIIENRTGIRIETPLDD